MRKEFPVTEELIFFDHARVAPLPERVRKVVTAFVNDATRFGTTHYENWITFGREQYLNRVSEPKWIGTLEQVADIFTKALDKTSFLKFRAMLLNIESELVTTSMREKIYGPSV